MKSMNNRKNNRLENYDYSRNGLYFITICTRDRIQYLCDIFEKNVGDGKKNVGDAVLGVPKDEYKRNVGNAALDVPQINKITSIKQNVGDGVLDVPYVKLKEYGEITKSVIEEINNFYNHIEIKKYVIMPDHIHMIIFKYDENDVMGTSRTPSPTNAVIPSLISTMKRFINKKIGFNIWQRSYFDHIIRSEKEFADICNYIENNPANWVNNKFNLNIWR